MSVLAARNSETHTGRYDALLRLGKAVAVCNDCDTAKATLAKELSEVTDFDFLHIVAFEKAGDGICWQLAYAHGKRRDDLEPILGSPPAASAYDSEHLVVTPDWRDEA